MLDITLLGTGALLPLPERALTAAALTCQGRTILFDCGEGTQTAMRRWKVSPMKVDVIALTHFHGDHIFGLPGLLSTLNSLSRTAPLTLVGPEGLRTELAPILALTGALPYPLRLVTLPEGGAALAELAQGWPDGARLTAFRTEHRVPSQGYVFELLRPGRFLPEKARALGVPTRLWGLLQRGERVEWAGETLLPEQVLGPARRGLKCVFSGDTLPCDRLAEAARDADLLISEATYGEDDQAPLAAARGHMTFSQAAQIAARAGVRRLWLAHFSQTIEDPAACLPNARRWFGEAACGEDGMRVALGFED